MLLGEEPQRTSQHWIQNHDFSVQQMSQFSVAWLLRCINPIPCHEQVPQWPDRWAGHSESVNRSETGCLGRLLRAESVEGGEGFLGEQGPGPAGERARSCGVGVDGLGEAKVSFIPWLQESQNQTECLFIDILISSAHVFEKLCHLHCLIIL